MKKPKIFLSYAKEDKGAARRLCRALRREDLEVWFDEDSLVGGQKWFTAITKAIEESDFFIALLSDASVTKRGVVQKEIRKALDVLATLPEDQIFIIPVRLTECKPSFEALREIHWIDLFQDWKWGIQKILRAIYPDSLKWRRISEKTPFEKSITSSISSTIGKVESIRISEAIHEAIAMFESYAELGNVDINLRDESEGARITIDPMHFNVALFNLLHNAVKYSFTSKKNKGWVLISISRKDKDLVVQVENVGVPIAKDEIDSGDIFKLGYRSRYSAKTKGLGIGLYVARKIMSQHSGDIRVESRPIRKSLGQTKYDEPFVTTVVIKLPLLKSTGNQEGESDAV